MKLNAQIIDLIQFASEKGYPVYVGLYEVTVDAFGDGRFHIFWDDGFFKVNIYRRLENKTSAINGSDEFKSLLYRRLHGEPDSSESQLIVSSKFTDDKEEDNYHEYL